MEEMSELVVSERDGCISESDFGESDWAPCDSSDDEVENLGAGVKLEVIKDQDEETSQEEEAITDSSEDVNG